MSIICPTITAYSTDEYAQQMRQVMDFAERIHIDFMDGDFAPTKSPTVREAWWPASLQADLHIMYREPMSVLEDILAHRPHMVVVHAEAEHVNSFVHELHEARIPVGIAILQDTPVDVLHQFINVIDHVLIFSGNLGHHGGVADLSLLEKVRQVQALKPVIEISWDGGINADNVRALSDAGVTVLNTGGAIQKQPDPRSAYENLRALIQS